jgi:transcriptional regulator with GAF, ATPase, and Fis domain
VKENRALVALSSALADSPRNILQTLAETILGVTQADSSGLSLLTTDDGGKRFYWPAIAGIWKPHTDGGTPRNFGPSGDVLDRNCTLLFRHFERRYSYLQAVMPAAEECLLVPFYVEGKAVGTIWAIMHDKRRGFDAEDERLLESLGKYASSAYQTVMSIDRLKAQIAAREKAEATVRELANGLETQVRIRTEELEQRNKQLAEARARLHEEKLYLEEEIKQEHNFEELVGNSPPLLQLLEKVALIAPSDSSVLISGETGTGKELIARAIHAHSSRKSRLLVRVNCGSIPAGLVESELFGHVKGAFTGATANRTGRFELADGGTLFLEEVGELPPDTQVKLLRVLQEQEFEPVGGSRTIKVDVRIIAATNRNLEEAVRSGLFRSDLYYWLNVLPLYVPPLRERQSDIPQLVTYCLSRVSRKTAPKALGVSEATMQLLVNYSWPGNIRELQNVIERAVALSPSSASTLEPDLLPSEISQPDSIRRIHPNTLRDRINKLGIAKSANETP